MPPCDPQIQPAVQLKPSEENVPQQTKNDKKVIYSDILPNEPGTWKNHFSSLYFSGSFALTCLEVLMFAALFVAFSFEPTKNMFMGAIAWSRPSHSADSSYLPLILFSMSMFRRAYNSYLEACFFALPSERTQTWDEHKLKASRKDLCGREKDQLARLQWHDAGSMLSTTFLEVIAYMYIDGFYMGNCELWTGFSGLAERLVRMTVNHLIMSFGMYWMHRASHNIPFLWRIHGIHHWAKHPLSRNTYEDHWFDNFSNAVVGQTVAQILVPLDLPTMIFSRFFRIGESLEKHSGLSSKVNVFHSFTFAIFPFAQMPHHHDWHHEGSTNCNFTFSSIGGVWDWAFNTRQCGRAANTALKHGQVTSVDVQMINDTSGKKKGMAGSRGGWEKILPVASVVALAVAKLAANGLTVFGGDPVDAVLELF
ncbi:hypothetical protein TrLO_g15548 [Triparma laevis f. longispina]|uniref:Fatty acid hydroxylase domain-containing protein n=1 Tax=Triparma laevis f. longispina TaxID=1714387 RepID=A0A9W7KTM1_9STRA|nr:hypothetical protein TrLO_g15548 [Triparma laevis f. longispina]